MNPFHDLFHDPPKISHPVDVIVQRLADLNMDLEDLELLVQHIRGCTKCREIFEDRLHPVHSRVA